MGCCERCLSPYEEPDLRAGQKRKRGCKWREQMEEEEDGEKGRSSKRRDEYRGGKWI